MKSLALLAEQEIINCHHFIEQWFRGSVLQSSLAEFMNHFTNDFSMVSPNGLIHSYSSLNAIFKTMYGTRPDVRIEVVDLKILFVDKKIAIATFTEHQYLATESLSRYSTAIFVPGIEQNSILWRHLHETWMKK